MRHRASRVIINSIKHFVQRAITNVNNATILNEVIVDAVIAPADAAQEVTQGSVIKAIFIEFWITGLGTIAQDSAFNITVEKQSGGQPNMTNAQSLALDAYPNKKNILYTTQGLLTSNQSSQAPVPLIRQWIAVPKGKQRFGLGDRLLLNFSNISTVNYQICGVYIYKEYS